MHGPGKLMLGTPAYENLAAVVASAEFLMSVGMEAIQAHERSLFGPLLDALLADDRVTVYGPHDLVGRAPTLAFNVAGYTANEVARRLAEQRIAVWDGNYYALEAMASYGIEAAVRAGIALYLRPDDVQRLIDAVVSLP
jgi:cysteine desulfurase/selenocysteine lyase